MGLAGFAATSLFTSLLEPLFQKKRPHRDKIALALLVAFGIILIASSETQVSNAKLGLVIALFGALLAAIYSIVSKSLVTSSVPGSTIMLYQIPASCLEQSLKSATPKVLQAQGWAAPPFQAVLLSALSHHQGKAWHH